MQIFIFSVLSLFFTAHSYRDYLHSKGIVEEKFITRVWHFWDAPHYEKHGMIGSGVLAVVSFIIAIN